MNNSDLPPAIQFTNRPHASEKISRPGISASTLAAAGIRHVTANEARSLIGYAASGLLLPYVSRKGGAVMVNGQPFHRLRLDNPMASAKYLSPPDSGCQLYEPPGLNNLLRPGGVLGVVEGEFKAISLVEAGFPCVGIGGITSACPRNKETGEPELLPALASIISEMMPSKIAFIGDADTSLIYAFSHEAVKVAGLTSVPIILPRIPFDAPGKGPDDLRALWHDQFPARWQSILDASETVGAGVKPSMLALQLLQRESKALATLEAGLREKAKAGIVKLAACLSSDSLALAEVEGIAKDCLGIQKMVFRAAVREHCQSAAREAAERLAAAALHALSMEGDNPLFFDGDFYWRKETDGAYGKLCRQDILLHLNQAGLTRQGDPSPCDTALHTLQMNNRVVYAGPLCGRPAGLHIENGVRVLATRNPSWIGGAPGQSPTLGKFILGLFGLNAGDPHALKQLQLFMGWLKFARLALRYPRQHRPGQVLAIVGPPNCGKSLLQSAVITPALGGRCADPGLFFTEKTVFNSDLWGAEHLALGDAALDANGAQRAALRNNLKRAVAETAYPHHAKGRDAQTFRPIWRISITANDDPESASTLPSLDASFADKIIYLRAYSPPAPFFNSEDPPAREAFAALLSAELPAFLATVEAFEVPSEMCKTRFGITEWHHPEILGLLKDVDPLQSLAYMLSSWMESWPTGVEKQELATVELYQTLFDFTQGNLGRFRVSTTPSHLGHQLVQLAKHDDWRGKLERSTGRTGGRILNRPQARWKITRNCKPE